jgi:hypothetical protein
MVRHAVVDRGLERHDALRVVERGAEADLALGRGAEAVRNTASSARVHLFEHREEEVGVAGEHTIVGDMTGVIILSRRDRGCSFTRGPCPISDFASGRDMTSG